MEIRFSDRDRYGAFAHRKVVDLREVRNSRGRLARGRVLLARLAQNSRRLSRHSFLMLFVAVLLICFAAPFAVTFVLDWFNSAAPDRAEQPSIYSRRIDQRRPGEGFTLNAIPICSGWGRALRRVTCLVDGDTGWERGVKWRLKDVDTPEISNPGCPGELHKGLAARDRLQTLMSSGYSIDWLGTTDRYNRQLVRIRLLDGRDAGRVLVNEALAREWPGGQKAWCSQ